MSTVNKIKTRSYFIKRLRDCGYTVDKVDIEYEKEDPRKWSIIIDNAVSSVMVTCNSDSTFQFYDGERYFPTNIRLSTDSIEIIVGYLNSRGIINKHSSYAPKKENK